MSERHYDIVTIGDLCIDLVMDLGDIVPRFGQTEQWVPGYAMEMGGSASIFACQAAKLGLRVAIIGRVGDDPLGQLIVQTMVNSGVDTSRVMVEPSVKTGLGVALCRADGDRAILTCAGGLNAVYASDITDSFLAGARHLHYCSYFLQTNLRAHVPSFLRRARELGLTVSLDTNWDPEQSWDGGLAECLKLVDLFMPNEAEALAITRCSSLEGAIENLSAQVPTVAIKCGARGSIVAADGQTWQVPAEPVGAVVDTIGAGDSYDAGFLAAWLAGCSPAECARTANACGRAATQAAGGTRGQLTAGHLSIPRTGAR